MSKLMHTLRLQPYWIALVILIVLSLWVASGMLFAEETPRCWASERQS